MSWFKPYVNASGDAGANVSYATTLGRDGRAGSRSRGKSVRLAWRAPVRGGTSWRTAIPIGPRAPPIRRAVRRVRRSGTPDPDPPFRTWRSPARTPRSPSGGRPGRGRSCGRRDACPTDRFGRDEFRAFHRRNSGRRAPGNPPRWRWREGLSACRYSRGRSSLGRNFDALTAAPEALQIVIAARFG